MRLLQSAKPLVAGVARRALDLANIDPAWVKALVRTAPLVNGGPSVRKWPWPRRRHFDKRERQAVLRLINREIRKGGAIIYGGVEERSYCEAFAK